MPVLVPAPAPAVLASREAGEAGEAGEAMNTGVVLIAFERGSYYKELINAT